MMTRMQTGKLCWLCSPPEPSREPQCPTDGARQVVARGGGTRH